ncbi:MAG TPA: hypothetical protein VF899_08055 [Pyrinomonadaceae bacterium]
MKTLKAICTAGILALALSVPASAGDVQTPGSPCPVTGSISTSDPMLETTDVAPATESDTSFSAFADVIWALASII